MKTVTIYGKDWVKTRDEERDAMCYSGRLELVDTEAGVRIVRTFEGGVFINGSMMWIGYLGKPGYFCCRFDALEILEE